MTTIRNCKSALKLKKNNYPECLSAEGRNIADMKTVTYSTKYVSTPAFEDVLDVIGSRGKFQKRLNIIYLCVGPCFTVMCALVYHLAMQTPDHWCHVPGRDQTNLSAAEWKTITIPSVNGTFDKCRMYNLTEMHNETNLSTTHCLHGWDYDDTWFSLTLPSQMNWVCDEAYVVNDAMFYIENIGVLLLLFNGYVGDTFGRRLQLLCCLAVMTVSRVVMVFTPSVLVLFILAGALVSGSYGPMLESAASVGMELTDIQNRLNLNWYMSVSTAVGMVATGLVGWVLRSWTYFNLFAALCCLTLLSFHRSVFLLSTYALVMSAGVLNVSPFVSLAAQGAAQLPALFVVYPCAQRFGRRWSAVASMLLTAFSSVLTMLLLTVGAPESALTVMAVVMQFCTSASGGIVSLQSIEVHPTCLRQITASVEYAASGLLLSLLPYIVFMGGSVDKRLPFAILSALNLLSGFFLSFLPETALQRLPDSLQDAAVFGKGHDYWSWKPSPTPVFTLKE
ncbi:solute carrier family 22 member 2-like isoform X2 [Schistocerca nitens]|uniref:solute carrier family 22 member 2-like isoform X2 n=1 Tax=Schistocerca nitens TaxID=7011 RepID=UPI0021175E87|nr:solute carrier family 22 member 2-like isoform X2 [Schistocerca nitens]